MKLQGIHDGSVYATRGRDVLVSDGDNRFDKAGQLPLPEGVGDTLVYHALTSRRCQSLTDRLIGRVATVNVWPLTRTDLLATVGRQLFVSADGGRHWERSIQLHASSGTMGVLPSAVTHHDGITYLGEYPLDNDVVPRILGSDDYGRTWSTVTSLPGVRHVHGVQLDPHSGELWVTTGDTDEESRIGRLRQGTFNPVGGGSQEWRAVELAFTPTDILWGMDSPYDDIKRIYRLSRTEVESPNPAPDTVHRVPGSTYYSATLSLDDTLWVVFSTAMEAGRDSTGPATQSEPSERGVVVASSSASRYTEWQEIASFRRRQVLADHSGSYLPRANGYVFVDADPELGLFVNPYNSTDNSGIIRRISPEKCASLHEEPDNDRWSQYTVPY